MGGGGGPRLRRVEEVGADILYQGGALRWEKKETVSREKEWDWKGDQKKNNRRGKKR